MLGLEKTKVYDFLNSLISMGFEVIAPVKTKDGINFEIIKNGKEVEMNYINTVYSPKKFFIPDGEILFEYTLNGKPDIIEKVVKKRRVLFGIRPCDANGLLALDKVLEKDPYYSSRRKNTLIIAVNCSETGENCFCQSMGTDKLTGGFDLLLTDGGKTLVVDGYSERGKFMLKSFAETKVSKIKKMKNKRKFDSRDIEKRILKIFNHKRWSEIAEKCLSCGACTTACPTCYCFSVEDEPDFSKNGKRSRYWSFCMLMDFSRVAGDVVFRRSREDRCKQFVFHKLSYFKEEYGKHLCVGCGRCISICPTGIDFFKEVEEMMK